MNNSLKNKKIIISAGASGIGWAATKIFLSRGATVYLCDIDSKSLNKTKKVFLKKYPSKILICSFEFFPS